MYPVDSVKTRMQCLRPAHQVDYSNVIHGLVRLIRSEGLRGSLRGVGAMIGGAGPAHAAYFGCYEHIKKSLENAQLKSTHLAPMVGGTCATLLHDAVMTPADAVKQRLQMYNSPYHNSLDCLRYVCRTEGPSVLYRAYFTQLTMNIPYQAIHFMCYEAAQDFLNPLHRYLPWTHMAAGALAGAFAAAFTTPLDVCKTLLNTQSRYIEPQSRLRGLLDAARLVLALHGLRGFLRGTGARVLSAVPGTAISWSVYEYFKSYLKDRPRMCAANVDEVCGVNKLRELSASEMPPVAAAGKWFKKSGEVACASSNNSQMRHTRSTSCEIISIIDD